METTKRYGKLICKAVASASDFLDRKAEVYDRHGIFTAVFYSRISGKFQRVGTTRSNSLEGALKFFGFTTDNIIG